MGWDTILVRKTAKLVILIRVFHASLFHGHIDCSLKSSCDPSVCQDRGSTACGDGTAFANSKLNHSTATYIVGPTVQYSAGQLEDKSSFSVNRPIEALRCGTFKPRSSSQLTSKQCKLPKVSLCKQCNSANYLKATKAQRLPPPPQQQPLSKD